MVISVDREIIYPDSDGQPMADNTKQFRWIVLLKENLECLFANDPQVFVAGDLLWYPVEGSPNIRVAPDVFVVFGRPKGDRGSYRQWQEDNIPPQVVFEILSPGNTIKEMTKKLQFYSRYGVEEYYIYDPDCQELVGLQRSADELTVIEDINNWQSPLLRISFVLTPEGLNVYYPNGQPFLTTVELSQQVESEKERAEFEKQRAESEKQRADRLAEKLRLLGVDPIDH
ncbi:Uma2 family endonuclease [Synechocystis sp. FACHB-383]|uniref:Uma2 family endonuclease n=1 Tax=Synechocystis sp. FACHB-383 TaxID=2692864 RepID=UPI0016828411|nr:Uma2 family endonuclease [Synechocystis sp. FACHB-383]MBD2655379.1 Uma2 family endonuclease [Synechocystis sp. FACHB-383]